MQNSLEIIVILQKKKKKKFYLHEEEKEKDRYEEVSGLMRGSTRVIWVGNYYYKG